jgi:hypothetical protein
MLFQPLCYVADNNLAVSAAIPCETKGGFLCKRWGLLDRSTARYFYKGPKTSLHKHTGNLVENLFSKKCAFENYLQLLTKKFLSQTTTTLKNGLLLYKIAIFIKSSMYQYMMVRQRFMLNKVCIYSSNISFSFCDGVSINNSLLFLAL